MTVVFLFNDNGPNKYWFSIWSGPYVVTGCAFFLHPVRRIDKQEIMMMVFLVFILFEF